MIGFEIINHCNKDIVIVDLSNACCEEIISRLQHAQQEIAKLPPKSVLILTNAANTVYNTQTSNAIKEFTARNSPYVKASAVIGADGLRGVLLKTVAMLTKREIKPFDTQLEAMDWLVSH
jgi:hypothetical protein